MRRQMQAAVWPRRILSWTTSSTDTHLERSTAILTPGYPGHRQRCEPSLNPDPDCYFRVLRWRCIVSVLSALFLYPCARNCLTGCFPICSVAQRHTLYLIRFVCSCRLLHDQASQEVGNEVQPYAELNALPVNLLPRISRTRSGSHCVVLLPSCPATPRQTIGHARTRRRAYYSASP